MGWTLDDLDGLLRLGTPSWRHDGRAVLWPITQRDLAHNHFLTGLRAIDVETGEGVCWLPPTSGVGSSQWWADGRVMVLLPDSRGCAQAHALDAPGAAPVPLTEAPVGVQQLERLADGRLACVGREEATSPTVRSFGVGRHGAFATAPPVASQLWVQREGAGVDVRWAVRPLAVHRAIPGAVRSFCEVGDRMVVLTQPDPAVAALFDVSLGVLDLASGAVDVRLQGALGGVMPSPDGRCVATLRHPGPEPLFRPAQVWVVDVAGGPPRCVSGALDRDVSGVWWLDDDTLLVRAPNGTRVGLWRLPLGGDPEPLELGEVEPVSDVAVGPAGRLAFAGVTPTAPAEPYVMEVSGTPRRLAMVQQVGAQPVAEVRTIRWTCTDGSEVDGVLVSPAGVEGPTPVVVMPHGGPMVASTVGFVGWRHVLAAQGWRVFLPNYRGSNHRGVDWQSAILGDPALGPASDILSGLEALRAEGWVDDERVAVIGWSYGGYLAAWLTAHDVSFVTAIAGAPLVDWFDAYTLSDLNTWFGHALGGSPFEYPDRYRAATVTTHADRLRTPMLILACTGDPRVPVSQPYKLLHALRDQGTEASLVVYPVAAHAPTDPVHQRDVLERELRWLKAALEPPLSRRLVQPARAAGHMPTTD
ncbi:MAG: prolyl oligopeptidase family serine peptidase [Myxococcales bacterium]|nr:prolyl oligopeptidase family serine peptidase [Myxococcales bacterium]